MCLASKGSERWASAERAPRSEMRYSTRPEYACGISQSPWTSCCPACRSKCDYVSGICWFRCLLRNPFDRQHRLDGKPLIVGEFVAHDSAPSVRGLNHDSLVPQPLPPLARDSKSAKARRSTH